MLSGGHVGRNWVRAKPAAYLLKHPPCQGGSKGQTAAVPGPSPPAFQQRSWLPGKRAVATSEALGTRKAVEVAAFDGSHYMIRLSYTSNTIATNTAEGTNGQEGNTTASTAATAASPNRAGHSATPAPIGTHPGLRHAGGRGSRRRRLDHQHRPDHQPARARPTGRASPRLAHTVKKK